MTALILALTISAHADEAAENAFLSAIDRMKQAVTHIEDSTYKFHQLEVVNGKQQPKYLCDVKFRTPQDIYMTWIGEKNTGRELLYRGASWNGGKLKVKPGPWIPTVSLDPNGRLATQGQRHTINNLGFHYSVQLFASDAERLKAHRGEWPLTVEDLGVSTVFGSSARCFKADLPKEQAPELYARMVRVCVDETSGLPSHIQAWDLENGELMLVEDYGYEDIEINVGLTDIDFDDANPAYNF